MTYYQLIRYIIIGLLINKMMEMGSELRPLTMDLYIQNVVFNIIGPTLLFIIAIYYATMLLTIMKL